MKFTRLLRYITPHRNTLVLIVGLLILGSLISLLNPSIAGLLTQSILFPEDARFAPQIILLGWLGILAVRSTVGFVTQYVVGVTAERMAAELRSRVYEHLQVLPLHYHQDRRQGDVLTLLSNDSEVISGFITGTLTSLLPNMLVFAGALFMMAWLDPLIASLALLLMPLYYLVMKLVGRQIRPLTSEWIKSWSGLVARVEENLSMLPAIKAFTRETEESRRFEALNRELFGLSRRQVKIQSIMPPIVGFLAGAGLLLLLWVGLSRLETGQIEPSGLVSLLLYAILLTQPISALANVYGQVMLARGAADRLLDLFSAEPEPYLSGGCKLESVRGEITFEGISFHYPGRPALLRDFTLHIPAGQTVALIGPNGAGKSTLVHLMMRFMEPQHGIIRIDGCDIRKLELNYLRQQIALVAQHTLLLNGSVAENIAYGVPDASPAAIKKAAKAAQADDFIEKLPKGYNTIIGDQGIKLSGGQRQRVALARALLKDPAILVLDEATAMFDPEGEQEFVAEAAASLKDKTVILITHRAASLALADRIVRLEFQ